MKLSITKLIRSALFLGAALPFSLSAQVFNMEDGQSKVIKTKQKIDTIFVSNPAIADYEILADDRYIIYARNDGYTEVTAFDEEGNELRNDTVNVNGMMKGVDRANDQIKLAFPNSNLSVKRVGKAYVIEGKAKSELEREEVNRIIGAALGSSEEKSERTLQMGEFSQDVPFLTSYRYKDVVDTSTLGSSTQINVRLSVVEVNKTLTEQLGIKWSNLPNSLVSTVTGSVSKNIAFLGNGAGGSIGFNVDNVNGFIQALQDDNQARILSEPNISMLSGEMGSILVGGEVPFVQYNGNTGNASIFYKDFGVKLGVAAKLLKDDRIRMFLVQEVSNVAEYGRTQNGSPIPMFSTRKSSSTFEIADGDSFVLGGLYSDSDSNNVSKFPILGDIPVLGAFFRNVGKKNEKRELIVVATVNLVKPDSAKDIVYPSYQKTGLLEEYFNIPSVYHRTLTDNFLKRAGFSQ